MTRILLLLLLALPTESFAQQPSSLTDSLVREFNSLWDRNDVKQMVEHLQDDAFFKSPYQLRYSRDTMAKTVLLTNPPVFRIVRSQELFNHVEARIAWSIGKMTSDILDENGSKTGKTLDSDYVYVFTKRKDDKWKVQMLIFHETS